MKPRGRSVGPVNPSDASTNMHPSETLDINGAADLLKVHPKTVLDMIGTGELPAARVGRAYVMLRRDVLDHIERKIISQTADKLVASGRRCKPAKLKRAPA